jgi:flagellar hook-associated protein 2
MASTLGIDGMVSGWNTTELIAKIMEKEKQPLTMLQDQKTTIKAKSDAWREINSKLLTMRNTVSNLKSTLTFKGRKATVSDSETLGATATTGAVAGVYKVEVLKLAQAHTITSDEKTSADTALGLTGTIKINGKEVKVASTDTLNLLADKVNTNADIGVSAAVVQVGAGKYKLTLTSGKEGSANEIQLEDGGGVLNSLGVWDGTNYLNEVQTGQNAELKVNGIWMERETNSINDIVQGVTLNLQKANPGKIVNVTVDNDFDQIIDKVKSFVEQYNALTDLVQDNMKYDKETKTKGPLFGDSTLNSLYSQLRRFVSQKVGSADSSVCQLNLVGISTGKPGSGIVAAKTGHLELDETKFREKLKSNFDDVAKLFGASITNVASIKNGATVSASSELEGYPASSLIDGRTTVSSWGSGAGWSSGVADSPGWVEIQFASMKTIDSMNIHTVNTPEMPANQYGAKDMTVEYWDIATSSWKSLTSVSNNDKPMVGLDFSAVTTNKIRVNVTGVNGDDTQNDYARLTEVEVFEKRDGTFAQMYDSLFEITRTDGLIDNKQEAFDESMDDLDDRIKTLESRLDNKETYYYKKFTAMEIALSKMQNQSSWLSSQLAALTPKKE